MLILLCFGNIDVCVSFETFAAVNALPKVGYNMAQLSSLLLIELSPPCLGADIIAEGVRLKLFFR